MQVKDKIRYTEQLKNVSDDSQESDEEDSDKSNKKKKGKKKKEGGPKRATNAYLFFSKEQRPLLKKDNPALTPQETVQKLSTKWKSLPQHEKQKYIDLTEKDKQRYIREKKVFDQDKRQDSNKINKTKTDKTKTDKTKTDKTKTDKTKTKTADNSNMTTDMTSTNDKDATMDTSLDNDHTDNVSNDFDAPWQS